MQARLAYLGLGGNLGDPIQHIIDARQAIFAWRHCLAGQSSYFYLSSPVGYQDQADFINCALEISTTAEPYQLLEFCQALELQLGRVRDPKNQNSARTIDIDILMMEEQHLNEADLTLPHPRMNERLFVLLPLLDLLENQQKKNLKNQIAKGDFEGQMVHRLLV